SVEQLRQDLNGYLDKHPRAQPAAAERAVRAQIAQLIIHAWLLVETEARALKLSVNQAALEEAARLDGCYVIQTDLPESAASKQAVHDRYQDLAQVEQAFRNCKNHAPGNPAHSRANGGTHPRSRPGGDAGLPDSAGTGPRLDFAGRYRRRGTAPIADSVLDGSEGGRRGELPQNPHAARRYGGSAPSPGSPPTGSAASHRDDCSHAQEAAHATKTPLEYYALAGKPRSAPRVNIRYTTGRLGIASRNQSDVGVYGPFIKLPKNLGVRRRSRQLVGQTRKHVSRASGLRRHSPARAWRRSQTVVRSTMAPAQARTCTLVAGSCDAEKI